MNIELLKATTIDGYPIFINEFKIESIWFDFETAICHIILESGNDIKVKRKFFDSLINAKEPIKESKRINE